MINDGQNYTRLPPGTCGKPVDLSLLACLTAIGYYREVIRTRILSEKVPSINEKYQNGQYNRKVFTELLGYFPRSYTHSRRELSAGRY